MPLVEASGARRGDVDASIRFRNSAQKRCIAGFAGGETMHCAAVSSLSDLVWYAPFFQSKFGTTTHEVECRPCYRHIRQALSAIADVVVRGVPSANP